MTSPRTEARDTRTLLTGYGLALLLTLAAFGLVATHALTGRIAFYAVLGLGFVQLLVHFRCFLHIGLQSAARANLILLLFSAGVLSLMVGGTLVVLFNLHGRMM